MIHDKASETVIYFRKILLIAYVLCFPNFGYKDINNYSQVYQKIHDVLKYYFYLNDIVLVFMQLTAYITQHNLTYQQQYSLVNLGFASLFLFVSSWSLTFLKEDVKRLIRDLTTKHHIPMDERIEMQMIQKATNYSVAVMSSALFSWVFIGVDSFIRVVKKGTIFVTLITIWPLTDDHSTPAGVGRIALYFSYYLFLLRVTSMISVVLSLSISLRFQYAQLNNYFHCLSKIFEEDLSQDDKDIKYENAMILGIVQHNKILE